MIAIFWPCHPALETTSLEDRRIAKPPKNPPICFFAESSRPFRSSDSETRFADADDGIDGFAVVAAVAVDAAVERALSPGKICLVPPS